MIERSNDPSPRVVLVNYEKLSIEEIMNIKMDRGAEKYLSPDEYDFGDMLLRTMKYVGEFLQWVAMDDPERVMESAADVSNGMKLFYPKLQERLIERKLVERAVAKKPISLTLESKNKHRDEESSRFE